MVTSVYFSGFSENPAFVYNGRFNPSIKKEKLIDAVSISEIMPGLWRNLSLPFKERVLLNQLLDHQKTYYPLEYYFYPEENYQKIIDFISLEISATCAGHSLSAYSDGDLLTTEQRKILNTADLGTNVSIHIKFKYKNKAAENDGEGNHLREGIYVVTVVPETEAAFPGGFEAITSYLVSERKLLVF